MCTCLLGIPLHARWLCNHTPASTFQNTLKSLRLTPDTITSLMGLHSHDIKWIRWGYAQCSTCGHTYDKSIHIKDILGLPHHACYNNDGSRNWRSPRGLSARVITKMTLISLLHQPRQKNVTMHSAVTCSHPNTWQLTMCSISYNVSPFYCFQVGYSSTSEIGVVMNA